MREKSVLRYGSMTVLMPSTVPLLIAQSVSECAKSRRPEGPPEARRTSSSLKGTSLMYAMRAAPHSAAAPALPGTRLSRNCLKCICCPVRSAVFQNISSSRWRARCPSGSQVAST